MSNVFKVCINFGNFNCRKPSKGGHQLKVLGAHKLILRNELYLAHRSKFRAPRKTCNGCTKTAFWGLCTQSAGFCGNKKRHFSPNKLQIKI